MRSLRPLPLAAGLAAITASALFWLMYLANGITSGSLVGLKGRERDIQVLSSQARIALIIAATLQILAWVAVACSRRRTEGEINFPSRVAVAIPISLFGTFLVIAFLLFLNRLLKLV